MCHRMPREAKKVKILASANPCALPCFSGLPLGHILNSFSLNLQHLTFDTFREFDASKTSQKFLFFHWIFFRKDKLFYLNSKTTWLKLNV